MRNHLLSAVCYVVTQKFFGLNSVSDIPELIGTMELPDISFSCIFGLSTMNYKMFSHTKLGNALLDQIFSRSEETIRIDWPAYPRYQAPKDFAPIILDRKFWTSSSPSLSIWQSGAAGAYGTSPNHGVVSHNEILEMYMEFIYRGFEWTNLTLEEQAKVIVPLRSNNKMYASKLRSEFPKLLSIRILWFSMCLSQTGRKVGSD